MNLTIHHAHHEVTKRALEAGRHVYSEKPLALRSGEAQELVELAAGQGLRLGCSPATFLGEAQQTAAALIRTGRLGTVRAVYAEVNWGRIETWHPAPAPFFDVGVLVDVGVYPLTLVTTIVRRIVHGMVKATDKDESLRSPTLVVSGGRDLAYPAPLVREMVAGIAGARHVEYPDAGHAGGGARYGQDACTFLADHT